MKQFGDVCQDADWQKMQSVQKNLRVLIFVKFYPCFFLKLNWGSRNSDTMNKLMLHKQSLVSYYFLIGQIIHEPFPHGTASNLLCQN